VDFVSARDTSWFCACGLGRGELVDETAPRAVVGGVGAAEALVAARHLLLAVGLERFGALVDRAPASLVLQACLVQPVVRDPFGEARSARSKGPGVLAEGRVE
jgi:hypothetical protein